MDNPFWQRAVLATIGPIVAAFVGTLGIGLFAARITERVQQRRQDRDLREQIIVEMTQTAGTLYFETQRYWRATKREATSPERLAALRMSIDERYHSARVAGERSASAPASTPVTPFFEKITPSRRCPAMVGVNARSRNTLP